MDTLSAARAEASRINGARSRGPITRESKTKSARNALKHGPSAPRHPSLGNEPSI